MLLKGERKKLETIISSLGFSVLKGKCMRNPALLRFSGLG